MRNELTARKSPCACLTMNGKVPGCPGSARRPGRPPSPRCWPAPASGWTSRAGAGPSGHGAGLPAARTFVNRGADAEHAISELSYSTFYNRMMSFMSHCHQGPLAWFYRFGILYFQKKNLAVGSTLLSNTEFQFQRRPVSRVLTLSPHH